MPGGNQKVGGERCDVAAERARLYETIHKERPDLPCVDPKADDYLEQLFAWGDAFCERYNVSSEDARAACKRARERLRAARA